MTVDGRLVSLAHLCMMEVAPIDLVRAAAEAGFDARRDPRLVPTSDGVDHGVLGNDARMAQLRAALDDTGVSVLDIEVVRLKPEGPGDVRPLLEAGQLLGCELRDLHGGGSRTRVQPASTRFASFAALANDVRAPRQPRVHGLLRVSRRWRLPAS